MLALPLLVLMWATGSSASNNLLMRSGAADCTINLTNVNVQDNGNFGYQIELNCPGGLSNWVLTWDIGDVTLSGAPSGATVTVDNGVATMLGTETWSQNLTEQQPMMSFYISGSGADDVMDSLFKEFKKRLIMLGIENTLQDTDIDHEEDCELGSEEGGSTSDGESDGANDAEDSSSGGSRGGEDGGGESSG